MKKHPSQLPSQTASPNPTKGEWPPPAPPKEWDYRSEDKCEEKLFVNLFSFICGEK